MEITQHERSREWAVEAVVPQQAERRVQESACAIKAVTPLRTVYI